MKKIFAMLLALAMMFSFAACGAANTEAPTEAATEPALSLAGTMEEIVNQIITNQSVEFMGGFAPVDMADADSMKYYTGLDNADQVTDVAVYEPMMGSIPFSMVLVRTTAESTQSLAESMKSGIDTAKWICVEADDLMVAGFGDVVMLIMVGTDTGLTAQSFVDAFGKVCAAQFEGAAPEFVLQ